MRVRKRESGRERERESERGGLWAADLARGVHKCSCDNDFHHKSSTQPVT